MYRIETRFAGEKSKNMATSAHFVKKARKDYPNFGIQKGDSYWWWEFAFGPSYKSKTQPKPSQLTRSEFLSTYLSIGEDLNSALQAASCNEDIQAAIDDAKSSIDDLKDETEGKLGNMPEQLQEADSGQLMQERIDQLDQWSSDLDGIDLSTLQKAEFNKEEKLNKAMAEVESQSETIDESEEDDELEDALQFVKDEISGTDPGIS